MRRKREITAIVILLVTFAISAIGYWTFSAGLPDGLEKTMEGAGVSEATPVYTAPFDYGGDYVMNVLMGFVGFFAVLLIMFAIAEIMAKSNETQPDR